MAVTSSALKQIISARISGVGAETSHVIGGTNVLTNPVDIAFTISFKCKHADNKITLRWQNASHSNKPTLEHTSGSDGYGSAGEFDIESNQHIGNSGAATAHKILDPNLAEVAPIAQIVAVYYEAPATNNGKVSLVSDNNKLGDIDLGSAGGSALITPHMSIANITTAITWATESGSPVGDTLKILVLANST